MTSTHKMPKSFRENPHSFGTKFRKGNKRGSSLMQAKKEISKVEANPYSSTTKSKTTSKGLLSSKVYGSSSLVRPKRIMYPSNGEGGLEPMNHDVAKQKLETLFSNNLAKKRDPLQLLTKPKK
jgi:hypothetical protein